MDIWMVIAIIVCGILFVLVEIFFIPGTTVVGVAGGIAMVAGVVLGYVMLENTVYAHLILAATSVTTVALGYLAYKVLLNSNYVLNKTLDGQVNLIEEGTISVGDTGETVSVLRPYGTARVNGKKFEVHSNGDYIENATPIKVVSIKQNKILVSEI